MCSNLPDGCSQGDIDRAMGGVDLPAWAEDYHEELCGQLECLKSFRNDQLSRKFSGPYTQEDITTLKGGGWIDDEIQAVEGCIKELPKLVAERARNDADEYGDYMYEKMQERRMEREL